MERIIVIGVSAGAGKSTFARGLGEMLELPVYHLDAYFWKPGWIERDKEEFREAQVYLAAESRWIIEGNYGSTLDIRLPACDTLIQLELPLWRCLWRVVKRRIQYNKKMRPDMAPGCPEKLDLAFLHYIVTTYHQRKKTQHKIMKDFHEKYPQKQVYHLRSPREIHQFLSGLGK